MRLSSQAVSSQAVSLRLSSLASHVISLSFHVRSLADLWCFLHGLSLTASNRLWDADTAAATALLSKDLYSNIVQNQKYKVTRAQYAAAAARSSAPTAPTTAHLCNLQTKGLVSYDDSRADIYLTYKFAQVFFGESGTNLLPLASVQSSAEILTATPEWICSMCGQVNHDTPSCTLCTFTRVVLLTEEGESKPELPMV